MDLKRINWIIKKDFFGMCFLSNQELVPETWRDLILQVAKVAPVKELWGSYSNNVSSNKDQLKLRQLKFGADIYENNIL